VLEENNATPITAGVSVSVDRASVTGLNEATVVATAANGYESGKMYSVYISTGTVDSVSAIGEIVAQFTIEASAAAQDLANGTDGLGAIKADTAATLTDTAEIGTAGAGLTDITLNSASIDLVWDELLAGHTIADTTGLLLNEWQDGGRLDLILDARMAEARINTTGGAVDDVTTVATTTTNTDMRGTDSAFLAANAPTNFSDLAITVTTGLISVGTISANAIDAASIAASALDGKGDWNIGKTGYSLTQAFPTNFASMSISATGDVDADVQKINAVTVIGVGVSGDLWRA